VHLVWPVADTKGPGPRKRSGNWRVVTAANAFVGSVRLIYAPGHTTGHQVLLISLENTGNILLSGDLYHTRANRALRRVPPVNANPEQTLASMDKVEKLLLDESAVLWIEHDNALADTLKKAPLYYD